MTLLALPVFVLMGIAFHELFVRLHVMADIRRVLQIAPTATRVIRSDTLSDLEKERAVRRMSIEVLRDTSRFTVKLVVVLGVCVALAAIAQGLFDVSPDGLYGLLTSWWALAALLVVMPLYAWLRGRGRTGDGSSDRADAGAAALAGANADTRAGALADVRADEGSSEPRDVRPDERPSALSERARPDQVRG